MAIRPEEITGVIKKQLEGYEGDTEIKEEGFVLQVGDGIVRIYGLANAMAGELLELPVGGVSLEGERLGDFSESSSTNANAPGCRALPVLVRTSESLLDFRQHDDLRIIPHGTVSELDCP